LEEYVRSSYVWRVGRVWKERAKRAAAAQWRRMRPAVLRPRETVSAAVARLVREVRRRARAVRARWGTSSQ
jgi:hypothetical protein